MGPVPRKFGGGLNLEQSCREQRKLAYYAPATALALDMHLYWLSVAADLWRNGDKSLEWILKQGAEGDFFAAAHSERGNDLPLFLSTTRATRSDDIVPAGQGDPFVLSVFAWALLGFGAVCCARAGGWGI